MPTYVYRCENCGLTFEHRQSITDDPLTECPECGGRVHRVIQPVPIIFKGPGFYVTDNSAEPSTGMPDKGQETREEDKKKASKAKASSPD
ncbi:MAG: FmdB family zinc ribbon protein [Chloroflexota bacterium]|nr:FmdB family zinc ribbon protein [Chloroflexota bacterium]